MGMTNEQRKVNKLLIKVKYNAYKLKVEGMIPSFLFQRISLLGVDSDIELVQVYMHLAEELTRVKGFYFRYPEIQVELEADVVKKLKERGFE